MEQNNRCNPYGMGENPPYSLYMDENGKWGLIDKDGMKLPARFDRLYEDRFSSSIEDVLTFDEDYGFSLYAWLDASEVWFNFTFDNPLHPEEFAGFLWERQQRPLKEYSEILHSMLPVESHWLIDFMLSISESDDEDETMAEIMSVHPEVRDVSLTNRLIDPLMRNPNLDMDAKCALWNEKVGLDYIMCEI